MDINNKIKENHATIHRPREAKWQGELKRRIHEPHHEQEIECTLSVDGWRYLEWGMGMGRRDQVGGGWRERVPGETTGILEHPWDELEAQCNGNSQESMRVTLAKIPRKRGST